MSARATCESRSGPFHCGKRIHVACELQAACIARLPRVPAPCGWDLSQRAGLGTTGARAREPPSAVIAEHRPGLPGPSASPTITPQGRPCASPVRTCCVSRERSNAQLTPKPAARRRGLGGARGGRGRPRAAANGAVGTEGTAGSRREGLCPRLRSAVPPNSIHPESRDCKAIQ